MPAARTAATRFQLLGCVLAAGSALTLSACGGGDGATAKAPAETTAKAATPAAPEQGKRTGTKPCPAGVDTLLDDLTRLRRQLAVGLSYDQYSSRVKQLRASYATVPIDRLRIECLRSAGTPTERALNKYIDGVNAWGECLADAACTTAASEPVLQRKWRAASHFLSEAA
jgi:hypothetical protein